MTRISEARKALIEVHQQNIDRYCRLLATRLEDHERRYLHKRIVEERLDIDRLIAAEQGDIDVIAIKSRARNETVS